MKMKSLLLCVSVVVAIMLLTSCSLPRRKDLDISSFNQKVAVTQVQKITIKFEESVEGKSFKETVWDNVSGPFWDIEESRQIGFTQNYKPQFFAIPPVLLPVVAESGLNLVNTRILIPFGNIFSGMFESAASKSFTASQICFDDLCMKKSSAPDILKIKIVKFIVWESPLNHLNLYAKGKSTHMLNEKIIKEYEFEKSMLSQKLGGVLSFHRTFMNAMDKLTNKFSEELTAEILEKGL
ncbi:MAG: hypothetical protein LLF28_08015 [Nitrospiraceae bacterium]|nr:hypothetical protein [Nitrospiraceae bacterium]